MNIERLADGFVRVEHERDKDGRVLLILRDWGEDPENTISLDEDEFSSLLQYCRKHNIAQKEAS